MAHAQKESIIGALIPWAVSLWHKRADMNNIIMILQVNLWAGALHSTLVWIKVSQRPLGCLVCGSQQKDASSQHVTHINITIRHSPQQQAMDFSYKHEHIFWLAGWSLLGNTNIGLNDLIFHYFALQFLYEVSVPFNESSQDIKCFSWYYFIQTINTLVVIIRADKSRYQIMRTVLYIIVSLSDFR